MLISKHRALIFGCFIILLAGWLATSTAYGEAGPFWHHRALGGKGIGEKIEENAQENVQGKGGRQTLIGTIGGVNVELFSKEIQVKGQIYNNSEQGQGKFLLHYVNPKVSGASEGCIVKLGQGQNDIPVQMHLAWKWDGTAAQLAETSQKQQKVDGINTPVSIQKGAHELPKATFTIIKLNGTCGILNGIYEVTGSVAFEFRSAGIEQWRTSTTISIEGGSQRQHFWNGAAFIGVTTGLRFNGLEAKHAGEIVLEPQVQEISVFEK